MVIDIAVIPGRLEGVVGLSLPSNVGRISRIPWEKKSGKKSILNPYSSVGDMSHCNSGVGSGPNPVRSIGTSRDAVRDLQSMDCLLLAIGLKLAQN